MEPTARKDGPTDVEQKKTEAGTNGRPVLEESGRRPYSSQWFSSRAGDHPSCIGLSISPHGGVKQEDDDRAESTRLHPWGV